MKMYQRLLNHLPLILVATLCACASTGTKVDESAFASFRKGESSCSQIEQRLGQPSQSERRDNGDLVLAYQYSAAQAHAENFIPLVGAFVGGYDTEHTTALFKCNSKDVLIKTAYLSGSDGAGRNLEAVAQARRDTGTAE